MRIFSVGICAHSECRRPSVEQLRNLDPFLMLDEFRVSKPGGFPDHPHRELETQVYLLSGVLAHEDFCGHSGQLKPGDLQWMTAGRGVVHAGRPMSEEPVVGLQLRVNLPKQDKMVEPACQELGGKGIPKPSQGGVTVVVISGEALGASSRLVTRTPTLYLDSTLQTGAVHIQPVSTGWTTFIYTLSGCIHIGELCLFSVLPSGSEVAHFVLIAGEPLNLCICLPGPFVMTTEEEIKPAIGDYQTGSNGFEKAINWRSKIRDYLRIASKLTKEVKS
ncbi:pirin [Lampris incognitus]|uniref:pirin n=1 Tax=Lampris incognitus TaxID=2546036 RepID=UPI0024B4F7F1|nr:pirin [Lampris incognitus]